MHSTQINAPIFFNKVYMYLTAFSWHSQEFMSLLTVPPFITIHPFFWLMTDFWSAILFKGGLFSSAGRRTAAGHHRALQQKQAGTPFDGAARSVSCWLRAAKMHFYNVWRPRPATLLTGVVPTLSKWDYLHDYYGSKNRTGVSGTKY